MTTSNTQFSLTQNAGKDLFRYRLKGDPRGWSYSKTPFFSNGSTPGPNEQHQAMDLGQVSAAIIDNGTKFSEAMESAINAINEFIANTYVVMNENTLGFVHAEQLHMIAVLAGAILKGGPSPLNGPVTFNPKFDRIRLATLEDFKEYRVSPNGHLI
jgi:hypothetical protein